MNLAIHSIDANLSSRPADTFLQPQHPDLKADFILANPPFNVSDWGQKIVQEDVRMEVWDAAGGQRQLRMDSTLHPSPCSAQRDRRRLCWVCHGERLAVVGGHYTCQKTKCFATILPELFSLLGRVFQIRVVDTKGSGSGGPVRI